MNLRAKQVAEHLTEAEVLEIWGFLSAAMLRTARDTGQIAWIRGKWGSRLYRPEAVEAYIMRLECPVREQTPYLRLPANGSHATQEVQTSTDSGLSLELVERAAQASALRISKKPREDSPKRSYLKAPKRLTHRLRPSSKVISLNGLTSSQVPSTQD